MKMNIKLTVYFLICSAVYIGIGAVCFAETQTVSVLDDFSRANRFYKEGQFEKAKDAYEAILDGGLESGPLYYNLANSYYKLGGLGRAILNYERAEFFIPQDRDLKFNIEFCRSLVQDGIVPRQTLIANLFNKLSNKVSFNRITFMSAALYCLLCILSGVYFLSRRRLQFLKPAIFLSLIFFITAILTLSPKIYQNHLRCEAVIIVPEAACRFAPSDTSTTYFKIYEGAKVDIVAEDAGWARIRTADSKIGWVKGEVLQRVYTALFKS